MLGRKLLCVIFSNFTIRPLKTFSNLKTSLIYFNFFLQLSFQKYELENNSYLFQYGPALGSILFRTKLAEFLTRGYKSEVNPADLVLTAGATNGIHHILSNLIDLDGFVFLDEVTYMIALEAIQQFSNIKIVPVKLNDDGVNICDLEEKLIKSKFEATSGKMFWGMYYTIPTFHNPTGIVFSEGERP